MGVGGKAGHTCQSDSDGRRCRVDSVRRTGFAVSDYDGRPSGRVTGDSAFAAAGTVAVATVSLAEENIWEGRGEREGGGEEV